MAVLTDTDILKILETQTNRHDDRLVIHPFSDGALTPVGYDLRIGLFYKSSRDEVGINLKEGEHIILSPGSTTNIRTMEWIALPRNKSISGFICSKVSLVSRGLSHISTTVDPDWYGHLSISVHNHASENIELSVGQPFCTVVFMKNISPATRDSGFAPSRTDTLITSITSQQKQQRNLRRRMKATFIAAGLLVVGLLLALTFYFAALPLGDQPRFHIAVMAGTAIIGSLMSGVIGTIVIKLLFDR
jgi:deoxycytidine triphosphate deaminase